MYDKPWLDKLTENDMPNEELKIIASLCGVKTAIALMKYLPGVMICIPNKALIKLRNNYICKQYDGTKKSLIELTIGLGISERQIFNIIKNTAKK